MVVLVVCGSDRVIGNKRASDCLACLMSAIVGLVRSRRTCDVCGSSGFGRLVYWNEFDSIGVVICDSGFEFMRESCPIRLD